VERGVCGGVGRGDGCEGYKSAKQAALTSKTPSRMPCAKLCTLRPYVTKLDATVCCFNFSQQE
jgi:hypothetical protein